MSVAAVATTNLRDSEVWIIDDAVLEAIVASEVIALQDDDVLTGLRPLDRGSLILLSEASGWGDNDSVKLLCQQMTHAAGEVKAFPQPTAALRYLDMTQSFPDIIVFDLVYGVGLVDDGTLQTLEAILNKCVSVVQVYANEPEASGEKLKALQSKYPRLMPACRKGDVDVGELAKHLSDRMESSLSAKIARQVRKLTSSAVESTLVQVDNLPLEEAFSLLSSHEDIPTDQELVQLLTTKIGEAVQSSPKIRKAIEELGRSKGVSGDKIDDFSSNVQDLLSSSVSERLQYDGWLYSQFRSIWEMVQDQAQRNDRVNNDFARQFFAFRVYDHPQDDHVRTGDIVFVGIDSNDRMSELEAQTLYLILTPPCDLAWFWQKTRGVLTLAPLNPISDKMVEKVQAYSNSAYSGESITARNPIVLPSIKIHGVGYVDYGLFAHELCSREFDGYCLLPEGKDASKGQQKRCFKKRPATYSDLNQASEFAVTRVCRVSEPFLGSILDKVSNTLFRLGSPDFPSSEKDRLAALLGGR